MKGSRFKVQRSGFKVQRSRFNVLFAVGAVAVLGSIALFAQQQQNFDSVQVQIQKAQGNIYMLVGAGGNVTVQIGSDGVLIVDTEYAPMSGKVLAALRTLLQGPLPYLIKKRSHPEHVRGQDK